MQREQRKDRKTDSQVEKETDRQRQRDRDIRARQ